MGQVLGQLSSREIESAADDTAAAWGLDNVVLLAPCEEDLRSLTLRFEAATPAVLAWLPTLLWQLEAAKHWDSQPGHECLRRAFPRFRTTSSASRSMFPVCAVSSDSEETRQLDSHRVGPSSIR